MKVSSRTLGFLLVISLAIAGCVPSNQTQIELAQTSVGQTVVALQTQVSKLPVATQTQGPTVAVTGIPTFTPVPTLSPTATALPATPTNAVPFAVSSVEDVTIQPGTVLQGGQSFVKTWRITNGGTSAWTKDFKIIFVSGDSMGVSSAAIGKVVYPGNTLTLSITFTAPVAAGTHTAYFMMTTPTNNLNFGLGPNFDRPWSIKIATKNLFAVTGASLSASPTAYSGICPGTVEFTPSISANGTGTVTYVIKTSSGDSNTYSLDFSEASTLTGSVISWPVDSSMTSLTAYIYIASPNHQNFGSITIPVTCTAPTP